MLLKYNTIKIAKIRKIYNLKYCYRSQLEFLKYRESIVKNLSNRIVKDSNYIYCYKNFNYFYINYLRSNFSYNLNYNLSFKFPDKNIQFIKNIYKNFQSMKDLNRILLLKAVQVNSLFKTITILKKKKKKIYQDTSIVFVPENKRILLVWSWLKFILKGTRKNNINMQHSIFPIVDNFLRYNKENNVIYDVKLQIYKMQLLRSL